MPLDKSKIDALLEEIKLLKDKPLKKEYSIMQQPLLQREKVLDSLKQEILLSTEKKTYFFISHHFKIVMLSINDPGIALEIWIKGVLPLLLKNQGLELDEWERLCEIGDKNTKIEQEMDEDWLKFFHNVVKEGKIQEEILTLIKEGRDKLDQQRGE